MNHSPDDRGSKAAVSRTARILKIGIGDLGPGVPLQSISSDPAGLDAHAFLDLELAEALGRVEDSETRLHLERLLRTLETLRRGHLCSAPGDAGSGGIDISDRSVGDTGV